MTKALANYTRAFSLQYKVSFLTFRIKDIVEDTMVSMFVPKQSGMGHIPNVRFAKLQLSYEQLLPFLKTLGKEAGKEGT